MTIYNIANVLTCLAETITAFRLYETFCEKREGFTPWIYGLGIIALTIMINLSNVLFGYGILNAVGMAVAFFVLSLLFKGKLSIKITTLLLTIVLIGIIEIIVLFAITLIFGITVSEVVNTPEYKLLGIIVSKMLTLLVVNIIYIKFKKERLYMGTSHWLLFLLIFVTSIIAVFLIFILSFNINDKSLHNLAILCSFGLLFSTLFVIYLYEYIAKQTEKIRNQEQYEQQFKMQLKHLDEILITQRQIKKFKHDFNNYMIGLQAYIDEHDFQRAKEYINTLKEKFKSGEDAVESGNTAFDAILNTKIAIAKSKGISVDTKIRIPESVSIDPIDVCAIFGNSLDNAIEACEKTSSNNKKISIAIHCKDEAVFCRIVNTAPKSKNVQLYTSKTDKQNHGFGLENITASLAKYNAVPNIERTDTEFILKFVIFINE